MADISGIVARQVGSIQGKVTAQVQSRVLEMLSKFSSECPSAVELQKISRERNNLLKAINSFNKRISTVGSAANQFGTVITSLQVAIRIIKSIPIPTAIIPPQVGGLGIPINVLTKYSDTLIQLNKLLDKLQAERNAILGIANSASGTVSSLKAKLESLDPIIQECSKNSPDLAGIVAQVQPKENTGSEGIPNEDYLYKGYTLEIVQDRNSPVIAPKRYAIAKDRQGLERLRGESSFSSDIQILLDELKFKIDNQFT